MKTNNNNLFCQVSKIQHLSKQMGKRLFTFKSNKGSGYDGEMNAYSKPMS